ncbi:hypothetical protein Ciccas_007565 [Cichlidogyrus casuarinus]|uniref:SNF2 N-terminal domain-containing protein n=1 Tax=Cichlidogyrus casuarinus TaxID=1844966 RepID=A0ABD2Q543_9PLAT
MEQVKRKFGFVQPQNLCRADIVLVPFSILASELIFVEVSEREKESCGRPSLRKRARYLRCPCPLTCIRWYRICLDESQMIESGNARVVQLLSRLYAEIRWCVTGTPTESSLNDFACLFQFLQVQPYSIPGIWRRMVLQPSLNHLAIRAPVTDTPLFQALDGIFWRNSEAFVADQLNLPPISEVMHWINFTPVERYVHDIEFLEDRDITLAQLPNTASQELIRVLVRIRMSCTDVGLVVKARGSRSRILPAPIIHVNASAVPRLDSGSESDSGTVKRKRTNKRKKNQPFTMTEVVRNLIDETRLECENHYRAFLLNKNARAVAGGV